MEAVAWDLTDPGPRAIIVVDLAFGDAGKGALTDALVRRYRARTIVRYNGGAQAGHNVVTGDGRHHCFSQVGAGAFVDGVRTLLGPAVIVHPTALGVEARHLADVGVPDALDRMQVHEDALVITPFHQAANRARERARGSGRHGSCGVGVGETARDALEHPEGALRVRDLRAGGDGKTRRRLGDLRERLGEGVRGPEGDVFGDPGLADRWLQAARAVIEQVEVVGDDEVAAVLNQPGTTVFEGAQGVLLDEWHGFHPHTTWSTCTSRHAVSMLTKAGFSGPSLGVGVLRSYAVRHGAGPLPTEDAALTLPEPHNTTDPWQGRVRHGWFDLPLLRYALDVCRLDPAGAIDVLALTHLDAIRDPWRVCVAYDNALALSHVIDSPDLDRQSRRTQALAAVQPIYENVDSDAFLDLVARRTGLEVAVRGFGPTAADMRFSGMLG